MTTSLRVGRLLGADILVRPSVLIMAALVVLLFQSRLAAWGDSSPIALGLWLALGLYVSVFIHEVAHLVLARLCGYHVETVTLHFFGGETAIVGQTKRAGHEFFIAVSGPIASLLLAVVAFWASGRTDGDLERLWILLAWINVLLVITNMLPGLPLDGGRALRGLLWGISRNRTRGTVLTAWIGRILGLGLLAVPFILQARGVDVRVVDFIVVAVVAGFLWLGASGAIYQARRADRIDDVDAARLAVPLDDGDTSQWPRIPDDLAGEALLRAMAEYPADDYALIDADGQITGRLRATDVDRAYRERKQR